MYPRSLRVPAGHLTLHCLEWGATKESAPVALCLHGLMQTGWSYAPLALPLMKQGWRVLAFDIIGHGSSDWSDAPESDYALEAYAGLVGQAVESLGLTRFSLVGSSLGGHVAIVMGAGDLAPRIDSLVLNDVPMFLPRPIMDRIPAAVSAQPKLADMAEADTHYRRLFAAGGDYDQALWPHYLQSLVRPLDAGGFTVHQDPALRCQIEINGHQDDRTRDYDRLDLPTLLIHAEKSIVLSDALLADMQARGPKPQVLELAGVGHVPSWSTPGLGETVTGFLDQHCAVQSG